MPSPLFYRRLPASLRLPIEVAIERVLRDHATGKIPGFAIGDDLGELQVMVCEVETVPVVVPFTLEPHGKTLSQLRDEEADVAPGGIDGGAEVDDAS